MRARLLLSGLLLGLAANAQAQTPPAAPPAAPAPDYGSDSAWLCLPGRADACGRGLPTADLTPQGFGPVSAATPAAEPPVDCFYVYPTVSRDTGLNSDLSPGATEELGVATVQFARFGSVCKTYAPLYRSVTLSMIPRALAGEDVSANFNLAYEDVRNAWRHYLAHYNNGRPYVLIGHSQGTIHLSRLLGEIEASPDAARMVSALLIGFAVEVPEGRVVGGTLQRTPLCTRAGETGCVVTYMSFRAETPPPADALMGRASRPGMTAGCVNPAALGGGDAALDSYWFAPPSALGGQAITWSSAGPAPAPFLHTNGLVSGTCRHDGQAGWLAISVHADPADARTDRIPGDVAIGPIALPGWGLHVSDMNYAMGDLIRLVETQSAAFRHRSR